MLNADKPQVVQNDRCICSNLCTDCCALIERIRSAAAPVRFYDQLNRPPAFKVNNTVSVLAEYQCAMNISRTVPVVGLCRIIAPTTLFAVSVAASVSLTVFVSASYGVSESSVYSLLPI